MAGTSPAMTDADASDSLPLSQGGMEAMLPSTHATPEPNAMSQQREVDLLVAGAGPAGMTAALVASLHGLSVLICEKSDQVGGTGATSAGTLWIPGNHQSQNAGFDDSAAKAQDYLDAL